MIVALCMARNEQGIIGLTVSHLYAQGVDTVIVEDGHSTDRTRIEALDAGATLLAETDRAYDQADRMTRLAAEHCEPGDWLIPFDADEFWYSDHGTIKEALDATDATKCWARMFLHRDWDHRAKDAKPLAKVAFRWAPGAVIGFGNHSVDLPGKDEWGVLDIREWQFRSFKHFCLKVERQRQLLAHTPNLDRKHGAHMNRLVGMSHDELEREWEQAQVGEWLFDPIPSSSSPR